MLCLGIESTAHTLGLGVVTERRVLENIKVSYTTTQGGIIPSRASDYLVAELPKLLARLKTPLHKIELIAFSQGPGIGHSLRIGAFLARAFAVKLKKPIIGVNHCVAHLEIGKLVTKAKDPVLLYTSGANTQVIAFQGGRYRIFGETLDMGVGNFLDAFGRELGLGFPAGPQIEQLALKGKHYVKLPYVVKGMDVSFGGLLTNLKQKLSKGNYSKEDLAYSVQETVFAMLLEVAERAMAHCNKQELLLGGGVACNKRLQEMARIMCRERNAELFVPANEFLVDNGAMIAYLGLVEYKKGRRMKLEDTIIRPDWRTDED
ncbi:tRNA (adenosine(37)-N6)-threonylcarbamoyltransferase complex transferase subunit TsaD [Candidatus Woesearchaeota archaeon]|nr:tRNA (adenosine(37)-N6)-threonylcarbamoyltransferase complex transferase subunit TsaD [Candidatus Woesearchaeota archaeon]